VTRGLALRLRLATVAGALPWAPAFLALAVTLLLSLLFLIAPGVDLAVSDLFFREGEGFALSQDPALRALRRSSTWVMSAALLGALAIVCAEAVRGRLLASRLARKAGWLLLGLALGPGLVVNTILKDGWGRPRPVQLETFGGEAPYIPVWEISDWCDRNCSFVSGEAASATWTVASVLLLPPAIRRWLLAPVLAYAVALSLNRVAFGGHFLSDILLSWALTTLVLALLWLLMVEAPPTPEPAPRPGIRPRPH